MFKQFWASFIRTLWKAVCKGWHSALAGRYVGEEGTAGSPALEAREVCFLPESETFARAGVSHSKLPIVAVSLEKDLVDGQQVGGASIFNFIYSDCLIFKK